MSDKKEKKGSKEKGRKEKGNKRGGKEGRRKNNTKIYK